MTNKTKQIFTFTILPILVMVMILLFLLMFQNYMDLEECINFLEKDGKSLHSVCSEINSKVNMAYYFITQLLIAIVGIFMTLFGVMKSKISALEKQIEEIQNK